MKDLFVSYGRKESLGFVGRMHQKLRLMGYDVWFDKVNIPDGDDYALRISNGIEDAQNFLYIMAPRCLTSPYCLIEIEYARLLGKRVIPINQMVVFDTETHPLSANDQAVMTNFYKFHNMTDQNIKTTTDVLKRTHDLLGRADWIYAREEITEQDISDLFNWQAEYENFWHKHDDPNYLKKLELPKFGKSVDDFTSVVESIIRLIEKEKEYIYQHSEVLNLALQWKSHQQSTFYLLPDKTLETTEKWLTREFVAPEQPPCQIIDLQRNYIEASQKNPDYKQFFVSYGRGESLAFAARMHQRIRMQGLNHKIRKNNWDAWFDKVNIPHGDQYQQRINDGIENAQNFIFIIAPHSIRSKYCLIEVGHAIKCGKRIIPILHIMPQNEDWEYASAQERTNGDEDFANELQGYVIHLQKIDWIYAREELGDTQELQKWRDQYENSWKFHSQDQYIQDWKCPIEWKIVDDFEAAYQKIVQIVQNQAEYVYQHTNVLQKALRWETNQHSTNYLPVGKERQILERWLLTEFIPPKQPPCLPTHLHCNFICAARKNAENRQTDAFICYDTEDKAARNMVVHSLSRFIVTTWTHDKDIQKGATFEKAIEEGIEQASNFLFFISPHSVKSDYCLTELSHALKYNKRIIPLLVTPTDTKYIPEELRSLQYIDFTANKQQTNYDEDIDNVLNILRQEENYFEEHKILLTRALKWKAEDQKQSFLLRGHNLDNAETWLRLNENRADYPPIELHKEFIISSLAAKGQLYTDVFISYSRKDGDFARNLNTKLQETGKMTWFDQESISTGVDFEKEIFKGIEGADNFLFVISPDSVESEYCEREVEYAQSLNKRLITILCRKTDPSTIPETLRVINWLDFESNNFDTVFPELVQTIDLDREHSHQHTILQQRAIEWHENKRIEDFLLNKTAYDNAQRWLDTALDNQKQPIPTDLQKCYISDTQEAIEKAEAKEKEISKTLKKRLNNTRRALGIAGIMVVLAVITALIAFYQRDVAIKAEKEEKKALNKAVKAEKAEKKALEETQEVLKRKQKLVDAFHFYKGEIGVATKGESINSPVFYFVNREGDKIESLQEWADAKQFKKGLAEVWENNYNEDNSFIGKHQYLLDTDGERHDVIRDYNKAIELPNNNSNFSIFDFSEYQFNKFPKELFAYKSLKILIINGEYDYMNDFSQIDQFQGLEQLSDLKMLQLEYSKLQNIPLEVTQLHHLKSLYLGGNYINSFDIIGQLANLRVLDLYDNNFADTLPPKIGELQNLEWLDLHYNKLTHLPSEIGKLQNLKSLTLFNNSLIKLPSEFGDLTKLKWLDLFGNKLAYIPKEFGNLESLIAVDLSKNKLEYLPESMMHLNNLQVLNLSNNQFTKVPHVIKNIKNLKVLNLSFNKLDSIPSTFAKLEHLQELNLSNNNFDKIPSVVKKLKSLQILHLGDNKNITEKQVNDVIDSLPEGCTIHY